MTTYSVHGDMRDLRCSEMCRGRYGLVGNPVCPVHSKGICSGEVMIAADDGVSEVGIDESNPRYQRCAKT